MPNPPSRFVASSPHVLGGTPVFAGTRVPVRALFEHLEAGETIEDFLREFPTVTREQALGVMEAAREALIVQSGADPA